ncbi:DNA-methyltransferase [Candidatus Palauibacter sp.]|uniref:DNA-methyltransferase n=1 Tax=Candidatus Palauibacter sp. TaxID=3101350 RepID=UPI003CC5AC2C
MTSVARPTAGTDTHGSPPVSGSSNTVRILVGDALSALTGLPDESVHCVVTSPPYWGLRDYGVEGTIGLEPTFGEHLDALVRVFGEVRRVLRRDGTLWLNYGDAYAGSWGAQSRGNPLVETSALWGGSVHAAPKGTQTGSTKRTGLKPKDLIMMPARIALALQADGWWLRSEIVWHKPNPMPESVRDRPTSAHEKIFLLTKSARYFYDAEAVRTPPTERNGIRPRQSQPTGWATSESYRQAMPGRPAEPRTPDKQRGHGRRHAGFNDRWDGMPKQEQQAVGANLRNVWPIATHPFPGAHFATFPPKLVEPCIGAGSSVRGCCRECGAPWARMLRVHDPEGRLGGSWHDNDPAPRLARGRRNCPSGMRMPTRGTVGWQPTCEHDADPVPCTVLDPFGGAGTVGLVANRLGRDAILIELNPEYAEMSRDRIRDDAPLLAKVAVEEMCPRERTA